jgi:radical SAM-linked protein
MRIRITFSKLEAMRFTGHLDLFRSWERTFRRSGLPLAYTQGFHPQPRLNLACALPLGFTSDCEILDAWLESEVDLHQINRAISGVLPPGLEIHDVHIIDNQLPALQTQVAAAVYVITFLDNIPDLCDRLQRIESAEHLLRKRRDKTYDLRPLIEQVTCLPNSEGGNQKLCIRLSARESATGRPEEVLDEIGIKFEATRVHREMIIFNS